MEQWFIVGCPSLNLRFYTLYRDTPQLNKLLIDSLLLDLLIPSSHVHHKVSQVFFNPSLMAKIRDYSLQAEQLVILL